MDVFRGEKKKRNWDIHYGVEDVISLKIGELSRYLSLDLGSSRKGILWDLDMS